MKTGMMRLLAGVMVCLTQGGCVYLLAPMWTPPPLDTDIAQSRTPEEDVRLLNDMFTEQETRLWGVTTQSVRWVETDVFRMYQCDRHYVIVYPPDWTPEKYSIMLLPGKIPDLPTQVSVLQQDASEKEILEGQQTAEWLEGLAEARAGVDFVFLGMDSSAFEAIYQEDPAIQFFRSSSLRTYASGLPIEPNRFGSWQQPVGQGREMLRCNFTALDNHIFRLHFQRGDGMTLMRHRLSTHRAVWVDDGVIQLPE